MEKLKTIAKGAGAALYISSQGGCMTSCESQEARIQKSQQDDINHYAHITAVMVETIKNSPSCPTVYEDGTRFTSYGRELHINVNDQGSPLFNGNGKSGFSSGTKCRLHLVERRSNGSIAAIYIIDKKVEGGNIRTYSGGRIQGNASGNFLGPKNYSSPEVTDKTPSQEKDLLWQACQNASRSLNAKRHRKERRSTRTRNRR